MLEENKNYIINDLRRAVDDLESATLYSMHNRKMHITISLVHKISYLFEAIGYDYFERSSECGNIRNRLLSLNAGSPFINRLQQWPRGYPGDFETIEIMCEGRPTIDRDHPQYWLEWYAMNSAIVQQHRNKIKFQNEEMFFSEQRYPRILSIGCGGARDVMCAKHNSNNLSIHLIDIDSDALKLAVERAKSITNNVQSEKMDAIKALRANSNKTYSCIVFGGLFDYFDDKSVIFCLRMAVKMLEPNGKIVFTNIASPCLFYSWMYLFTNWTLILRDEAKIKSLWDNIKSGERNLEIRRDETGLSLLCTIK